MERSGWRVRSAHPEEALDRAAAIGCNPSASPSSGHAGAAAGAFDEAALDRYVEILALCAARGLEPMVTLHHFTHPVVLGEEFWLRPGSPDVSPATWLASSRRWLPTAGAG